jgi:small subunit ribosomal protein S7
MGDDENTNPAAMEPSMDETAAGEPADAVPMAARRPEYTGPNLLLFEKYDLREVVVTDPGLIRYINLQPILVPHTGARHGNKSFAKHKMNVVERLINEMMRTEAYTGKKNSAFRAVREALETVATRSKENPVQVLVRALENAAPREEVTRLRYGGISVPKAVDVAPARRLDQALRRIASGAVEASHKSKNTVAQCLADEVLKASKNDMNSFAVAKKEEIERVAKSAR